MADVHENAQILIDEIQAALDRGTKHYSLGGQELTTVQAIVEALLHDGQIVFEPTKDVEG